MLEDTHPVPRVRRQAANLRFIIEAPKMELGADERVQIPPLREVERKKCARNPTEISSQRLRF